MPSLKNTPLIKWFVDKAKELGRPHEPVPEEFLIDLYGAEEPGERRVVEIPQGDSSGYYAQTSPYAINGWLLMSIGPRGWKPGALFQEWIAGQPRKGEPNPDNWVSLRFLDENDFKQWLAKPLRESKSAPRTAVSTGEYIAGLDSNGECSLVLCVEAEGGTPLRVQEKPDGELLDAEDLVEIDSWVGFPEYQEGFRALFESGERSFSSTRWLKQKAGWLQYLKRDKAERPIPKAKPLKEGEHACTPGGWILGHLSDSENWKWQTLAKCLEVDEFGRPTKVELGCGDVIEGRRCNKWRRVDTDNPYVEYYFHQGGTFKTKTNFDKVISSARKYTAAARTGSPPKREKEQKLDRPSQILADMLDRE